MMYRKLKKSAQKWHWRVPIALQIVFIVFLIVLALLIPESPRWLAAHGREEQALSVYSRLADRPSGDLVVENEWNEIMTNILLERQIEPGSSWSLLFRSDTKQSRRRFLIACSIQAAQQLGGINVTTVPIERYVWNLMQLGAHLLLRDDLSAIHSAFQRQSESCLRLFEHLVFPGVLHSASLD